MKKEIISKNDLINLLKKGMNCNIIGLKLGVSHVKINWLLRKYNINIKEIQKDLPKYYVYVHKYNDKVFYVGSAQGDNRRLWSLNKRSDEWKMFVESIDYNFDAEIIEICENRSHSHSREHYWGHYFRDKDEAEFWYEDNRGSKNISKNRQVVEKSKRTRRKNKEIKDGDFVEEFIKNNKPSKIENTGRNRKIVLQLLDDGTIINRYESITKASEAIGVDRSVISRACKHGNKCRGFYWKFDEK